MKTPFPIRPDGVALRIVRDDAARDDARDVSGQSAHAREAEIAATNQEAAAFASGKHFDAANQVLHALLGPRQVFVHAVEERVQGGRAAIITPDDRDLLLLRAKQLGLRAFDAHLLIATVQDATRRGERAWITRADVEPTRRRDALVRSKQRGHVSLQTASRLHDEQQRQQSKSIAGNVLIAVTLAMVLLTSMIVMMGA